MGASSTTLRGLRADGRRGRRDEEGRTCKHLIVKKKGTGVENRKGTLAFIKKEGGRER